MKLYKAFVVIIVALMFVNCTDDFSDINQNPSAINAGDISARYFITKSQVKLMAPDRYPYWRAHLIHADRYAGHFCFGHSVSWWSDELGYSFNGGYTDAAWDWLEGYTGNIVTYLQLTGPGGDKENSLAYATALIIKSIYYQYFTDVFGDVPYSEAGNLDVLLPKFDAQRDIYEGIIEDLTQAMTLIGDAERTGDGEEDLGENDLFYGGDLQKWKKLANTLKLRAGLRALGASDADFAETAVSEALAAPLLSSEEDNALLPKDNEISQWNSACYGDVWYNFIGGGSWTVSQDLINHLKDNGDPRLTKYAQPAVGGEGIEIPWPESDDEAMYQKRKNFILDALDRAGAVYEEVVGEDGVSTINMAENTYYVGQPVRLRQEMKNYARFSLFSTPSQYIIQAKGEDEPIAPEIVLTTAESYFLQAEAIVRGVGSGDANALYRQGIRYAMLLWDVEPSEIDDYLMNSPMANLDGGNDLEKIAIQRWLAYYTEGFQAWAVVRDLGFPADLADGVDDPEIFGYGNIAGKYPTRMRYGSNAYSRNNENLQDAIDRQGPDQQDTELWWAK
ncbi:SusD/RagB family nutrient-binding outer membrane lipoprotein [Thermophagus sp. OGC60D27]|uniref:SusD/RagB family nutrient-binding outer membrane lipoprotein n=1 Tax=Thermophagus sp. OGC60D27 TaxID=3458415 RepID=UPI004037CAD9